MLQEVSLTGATLVDSSASGEGKQEPCCSHDHGHSSHDHQHKSNPSSNSHNHGSQKACCSQNHTAVSAPRVQLQMPVPELVQQPPAQIRTALRSLIQMAPAANAANLVQQILDAWQAHDVEAYEAHIAGLDENGHTLLHWATKRPDAPVFVQTLLPLWTAHNHNKHQQRASSTTPASITKDSTLMNPLHWACTEQKNLVIVRLLLEAAPAWRDARDSTGCTPLLIAAQYGQVETVAYLLQKGADLHVLDDSRDSATHWAAYKGSHAVLGLLSYYSVEPLTAPDAFGQTPLHLAALRGHPTVCRYIIESIRETHVARRLLDTADKNGRTPLALAKHKEQWAALRALQECQQELTPDYSPRKVLARMVGSIASWRDGSAWKVWMGLATAPDLDQPPKAPYYYVLLLFALNFVYYLTVLFPIHDMGTGLLWDCVGTHALCAVGYTIALACLIKVSRTDPGSLDSKHCAEIQAYRDLYQKTLERYAQNDSEATSVQLCHTCHIARPPRSKHDRYTRRCVLLFDHHCPFVGATIGLHNYASFYVMLAGMTLYFAGMCSLVLRHAYRMSGGHHWPTTLAGVFLGVHILMTGGMLIYHTQLVLANLTTNEHLQLDKYPYLWEPQPKTTTTTGSRPVFRNPWNRGWMANVRMRWHGGPNSYALANPTSTKPMTRDDDDAPQTMSLLKATDGLVEMV